MKCENCMASAYASTVIMERTLGKKDAAAWIVEQIRASTLCGERYCFLQKGHKGKHIYCMRLDYYPLYKRKCEAWKDDRARW